VHNKIAFERGGSLSTGGIYLMNPDGSGQQLTVPMVFAVCSDTGLECFMPWRRPSWHPDGMRLATASTRMLEAEIFRSQIFLCSSVHPECDVLLRYPSPVVERGGHSRSNDDYPAWSPQGDRLAFSSGTWVPAEHAFTALAASQLSWSPDGNRVVFAEREQTPSTSDMELWISNADGSGRIRITDNAAVDDENPAWSPDGTQIAFATNRDSNFEIYLYRVGDGSLVNLTQHAGDDRWPTWSPDGTRIAFQSNRDGNEEIYSMSVDGSDQVNLTNDPAIDSEPAWSPN
jgi:Tol biopolymer transport system component